MVHCENYFVEVSSCRFYIEEEPYSTFVGKNRTRFQREANQADNKAATVAVDSLINFEAAKVRKNILITPPQSGDSNHFHLVALEQ